MNSQNPSWSDVRVFLAVVRTGSTLAASRELGMAQPTVARRIDAFEHALGLRLFDRNTRGFRLTQDGAALVDSAEHMEKAAQDLSRKAMARRRMAEEVVRVTAAGPFIEALLSGPFQEFSRTQSNLRFDYLASGDIVDLEAGEADIALRSVEQPSGDAALCRRLPDYRFSVFCSKDYAASFGAPKTPEDLSHHPFVAFAGPVTKSRAYRWFVEQMPEGKPIATCNNQAAACQLLRKEGGVAVISHLVAQREPGLCRCFAVPADFSGKLWFMVSPEAQKRPMIRNLMDFSLDKIAAAIKENNKWPG